jgi:hypothetical protein
MDEINEVDFTATESIERFMEGQAFLPLYDFSPPPPPQVVPLLSLPVCPWSSLLIEVEGVGEEPNHTTARKSGPL